MSQRDRLTAFAPGVGPDGTLFKVTAPRSVKRYLGRGALWGLVVGDAFGSQPVASDKPAPLSSFIQGVIDSLKGVKLPELMPGTNSDDLMSVACLADNLMTVRMDQLDLNDLFGRYLNLASHADQLAPGLLAALALIKDGCPPHDAGARLYADGHPSRLSNRALFRTLPIALWFAARPEARRTASLLECAISHFDPHCQLACVLFNEAIVTAVRTDPAPEAMFAAATQALDGATDELCETHPQLEEAAGLAKAALVADLEAARREVLSLELDGVEPQHTPGHVRVSLRLAFWHLLHTRSFEAAMTDVVNRGGDVAGQAAITGALLGASLGRDAIPEAWKDALSAHYQALNSPSAQAFKVLFELVPPF